SRGEPGVGVTGRGQRPRLVVAPSRLLAAQRLLNAITEDQRSRHHNMVSQAVMVRTHWGHCLTYAGYQLSLTGSYHDSW
ncbi:hypothetical protein HAX54_037281, partial [Datura stramonium]|nr:hypothetical protein [Datura stramonium]